MNREVTFYYKDEDESVVEFRFDAIDMDSIQLFMKWVQFMNAIGYVLDTVEMEDMWNSVDSESERVPSEDFTSAVLEEFGKQMTDLGVDRSNDTKWHMAVHNTILEMRRKSALEYGMFS